jgi:Cys-tRNA(Pro)/Cys-tRNA(Cys) deacylase
VARQRSGGTPATVALDRAGIDYTLRPYDHDPRGRAPSRSPGRSRSDRLEGYGLEAATALGVDPARVFKTLLANLDGRLVVGVVPVSGQLDLKALARALGGRKAVMADVAAAERATGYVAGGISPVGQKRRLPTVVDASALDHATVLVSGGRRGLDLELAPADLVATTGAIVDRVGRGT